MPRSFYARAALILILPVIVIQLAVAVMFLQRHYEDVTVQMTSNMTREIALVRAQPALAEQLGVRLDLSEVEDRVLLWDLSAEAMRGVLFSRFADVAAIDTVSQDKTVLVGFSDGTRLVFPRSKVSASNPHQLLVLMVGTALVMTAISILFMRGQIRPIRRLARAAEAFGRGQNVSYIPGGATEVRAAGTAFLDMRARIERHMEQRTLLLSGVSHDLRTPLTRMKLELSMMDAAEVADLQRDLAAMERIIDTFLTFAQQDATDTRARVDALALLQDAARMAAPQQDIPVTGQSVTVDLYADGIQRALSNLIRNALTYGNRARASVTAGDTSLTFTVEDDGPGIPEAQRDAATRPFARLDRARSNTNGNVGLGLSIVQDVARAHGGLLRLGTSDLGGLKAEIVIPL
ncbi:two-component sensor histidine kinase [Jannaschia pagri]|uniref:histidine kinase n=1 Tax=Jannaschia pagri TaxID=2829797 RepID=A0ABQ4NMJ0_9RHOB|nr:two-component sensor histidine kinase [Jannaschia sp. AI_61]GIT95581.1 two-component sensor histidine kinase [Jannaschia sp. AI_62]